MDRLPLLLGVLILACTPARPNHPAAINGRACDRSASATQAADTAVEPGSRLAGWQPRVLTSGGPPYPQAMLERHVEGRVLSSFVIDTLGRVVAGSARIHEESSFEFGQAVCAWLREVRFAPLRVDGRARTVLLRYPLTFSLGG